MNAYTINMIQDEMTAAGSHWWDKGTMRFFRCRVAEQVYQGRGGIYFVTSEKSSDEAQRKYSVRKYDPATKQIDTVGDFNSMSRSTAHRRAAQEAGEAAIITKDAYREPTNLEQFVTDIVRGGGNGYEGRARELMRLARNHQRMMEDYCNIPDAGVYDDEGNPTPRLTKVRKAITGEAEALGCGVKFSGDPRGVTVKLVLPNGETNDWGKEGWCVPIRD